jgi:hypothetical protein
MLGARERLNVAVLLATLLCWTPVAGAAAIEEAGLDAVRAEASQPFILGPPKQVGPVVVQARFELHDINAIDDNAETFEFVGVLELQWRDPRQAFDPAEAGVEEKVFQGNYQFNEVATGWYPQVVLVNESGLNQNSGVVLRVRSDGTSTLLQTICRWIRTRGGWQAIRFEFLNGA